MLTFTVLYFIARSIKIELITITTTTTTNTTPNRHNAFIYRLLLISHHITATINLSFISRSKNTQQQHEHLSIKTALIICAQATTCRLYTHFNTLFCYRKTETFSTLYGFIAM